MSREDTKNLQIDARDTAASSVREEDYEASKALGNNFTYASVACAMLFGLLSQALVEEPYGYLPEFMTAIGVTTVWLGYFSNRSFIKSRSSRQSS